MVVGREIVGNMTVERTAEIGQEGRLKAEILDDGAQFLDVARRQMAAGQHIDRGFVAPRRIDRRFHQFLDHAGDGLGPTVLEGVFKVRRRDIDDGKIRQFGMVLADQADIAVDVVALGFGDAGRGDADDFRLGALDDVEHRLFDVFIAAENRRDLAHRGRLHRNRFLEMPDEQHEAEGGAALRAMQQRHGAAQAHEGQRRADGLAHLERIDRAGFFGRDDLGHPDHSAA